MGIKFDIVYHQDVVEKDIPKLSHADRSRIKKAIEDKIIPHPELFGKPLRQSLKGYRKLRVGDYRVIYRIENSKVKINTVSVSDLQSKSCATGKIKIFFKTFE